MILSLIYIYLLVTFNYGYAKVNYRNSNVTINLCFFLSGFEPSTKG